jgi:hypothetical protein
VHISCRMEGRIHEANERISYLIEAAGRQLVVNSYNEHNDKGGGGEQNEIVICILITQQTCSYRITHDRIEMERAIQRLSCHDIPVLALEVSLFYERYASQIDGPKTAHTYSTYQNIWPSSDQLHRVQLVSRVGNGWETFEI